MDPLSLIVAPKPSETQSQSGSFPRCDSTPLGAVAKVKPGARAPSANGCGSSNSPVPNLVFGQCCNNHDYCYDDCSQDFDGCNHDFLSCNREACYDYFDSWWEFIPLWGCLNLAEFYASVVESIPGMFAFNSANNDRCECGCPEYTADCNDVCLGVVNDASNCGSCGHTVSFTIICPKRLIIYSP